MLLLRHVDKIKQDEVNKYLSSYHMSFDELTQLIQLGIQPDNKCNSRIESAFRKGAYLGCPGKDIHFALMMYMSTEQEDALAELLSVVITHKPTSSSEHLLACFRYIYGCFDKQGVLLSKHNKKIISQFDWDRYKRFVNKLQNNLEAIDNVYGLMLLHEMQGHRTGDEMVVNNNADMMSKVICHYEKSMSYLPIVTNRFSYYVYHQTPYYWCARYLEYANKQKAVEYYVKNIRTLESHSNDKRKSIRDKVQHSLYYIQKYSNKHDWEMFKREVLKYKKNICFKYFHKCLLDNIRFKARYVIR